MTRLTRDHFVKRTPFLFALFLSLAAFGAEDPAYRRGVNIAGAEFGDVPGTREKHYTYNDEATFAYFAKKGFDVLRVPIKWERIQPTLGGPLNPGDLSALKKNIAWAKAHNTSVV